jgi:UDP-N-acetylglucosamine 2-epimerase
MWGKRKLVNKIIAAIPHPLLESCAPYMFAQYVCVWGEAMRRHLVKMGREDKSIFITGSPAFDNIKNRLSPRRYQTGTVMYVQQRMNMPLDERIPFYSQIINTVINELGYKLIFKLHPNSFTEIGSVKEIAKKHNIPDGRLEILDYGDAVELLHRVDAVMLATSTTAYHAVVAGVPLVILDYYSSSIHFEIGNTGGGAVVYNPEQLSDVLRKVMSDEIYRQQLYDKAGYLLDDHLFALDGQSVKRVVEVIQCLLISHQSCCAQNLKDGR